MQRNPTETAHIPKMPLPGPRGIQSVRDDSTQESLVRLRRIGGIDELHHMAEVLKQCDMPQAAAIVNRRAESLGQSLRPAGREVSGA